MKYATGPLIGLLMIVSTSAAAKGFEGLQGYTVLAVMTVDGTFNGCAPGRSVPLEGGFSVECIYAAYQYAFRPEVAVLVSPATADDGTRLILCKLMVDDTAHLVNCNAMVRQYMRILQRIAADGHDYAKELVTRYEAIGIE